MKKKKIIKGHKFDYWKKFYSMPTYIDFSWTLCKNNEYKTRSKLYVNIRFPRKNTLRRSYNITIKITSLVQFHEDFIPQYHFLLVRWDLNFSLNFKKISKRYLYLVTFIFTTYFFSFSSRYPMLPPVFFTFIRHFSSYFTLPSSVPWSCT